MCSKWGRETYLPRNRIKTWGGEEQNVFPGEHLIPLCWSVDPVKKGNLRINQNNSVGATFGRRVLSARQSSESNRDALRPVMERVPLPSQVPARSLPCGIPGKSPWALWDAVLTERKTYFSFYVIGKLRWAERRRTYVACLPRETRCFFLALARQCREAICKLPFYSFTSESFVETFFFFKSRVICSLESFPEQSYV